MTITDIVTKLRTEKFLSLDDSFQLAHTCSLWLGESRNENNGRRILINVLDQWEKIPGDTHEIWTDLIEIAGFYPYLEKEKSKLPLKSISGRIRKEFHISENLRGKYFQEEQKHLLDLLNRDESVVVSAPTSFGKSLLIEEIVASNKYRNIVVIQPTLALLDETRRKLLKYQDAYKIIVRTSQEPADGKGNLFLLTAERVYEYPEFPHIDFLVVDEFYKLSAKRRDTRADVLNNSFYNLYKKFQCRFYLLGPNIDGISEGFEKKYNAVFYKTDYSLVDCLVTDVLNKKGNAFSGKKKKEKLFALLKAKSSEQTIIFCSAPDSALKLALAFIESLPEIENPDEDELPLSEWIRENISPEWGYITLLKAGIGVHTGALPKHITTSIIEYFNSGKLKYLFCTTTIIEGVNTSAKNMIFYDRKKGGNRGIEIDYFDYSNIKGRSGRLMEHYTGNMYNFNPVPEKEDLIIDIPFFEQNPVTPEVLISLEEEDVRDKESDDYKFIESLEPGEKELFRKSAMTVHGQKKLYDELVSNYSRIYPLINWTTVPSKEQLQYVLELAWEYLLKEDERTDPVFSPDQLRFATTRYLIEEKTLKGMVALRIRENERNRKQVLNGNPPDWMKPQTINKYKKMNDEVLLNDSVNDAFKLKKNWFEYRLPKWLKTLNDIQTYVCTSNSDVPGNYTHFSSVIENESVQENLAILSEFGIPNSAIRKLEKHIPDKVSEDDVLKFIKAKKLLDSAGLIEYEKAKIRENF